MLNPGMAHSSGKAAKAGSNSQVKVTSRKPSRGCNSGTEGGHHGADEGHLGTVLAHRSKAQRHRHQQGEDHHDAPDQGDDGQSTHQNRKVALTWNSFSTWRTIRFLGTKMMTWSLGSTTVS